MNLSFSPNDDALTFERWPRYEEVAMRAMRAEAFGGSQDLKLTDIPSPALSDGRVLVRMTAAGVTPLDHTILFGQYPNAKAPLVLGNEGAGIVEGGGTVEYPPRAGAM